MKPFAGRTGFSRRRFFYCEYQAFHIVHLTRYLFGQMLAFGDAGLNETIENRTEISQNRFQPGLELKAVIDRIREQVQNVE